MLNIYLIFCFEINKNILNFCSFFFDVIINSVEMIFCFFNQIFNFFFKFKIYNFIKIKKLSIIFIFLRFILVKK